MTTSGKITLTEVPAGAGAFIATLGLQLTETNEVAWTADTAHKLHRALHDLFAEHAAYKPKRTHSAIKKGVGSRGLDTLAHYVATNDKPAVAKLVVSDVGKPGDTAVLGKAILGTLQTDGSITSAPRMHGSTREILEAAQRGKLPPKPDFSAETHARFRKKLEEAIACVKAGDPKAVDALRESIKPVSTSPKMIRRYLEHAAIALRAKAKAAA